MSKFYIVPTENTSDVYAAGIDGNDFESLAEARAAIRDLANAQGCPVSDYTVVEHTLPEGTRVRTVGLSAEDSDAGSVLRVIDADTVEVAWDSGVRTSCDVDRLREE